MSDDTMFTKMSIDADMLRPDRIRAVVERIESVITMRNQDGYKSARFLPHAFADFSMLLFEDQLKEKGFDVSYYKEIRGGDVETHMIVDWP